MHSAALLLTDVKHIDIIIFCESVCHVCCLLDHSKLRTKQQTLHCCWARSNPLRWERSRLLWVSWPLNPWVRVPPSLPACLTDGLFVLPVSVCVLFALRRSALQYRPWTCKKKEGSPLMYFTHWGMWRHTNGCIKQVCDLQTKGADVCCCWSRINQLRPFSDFSTVIPISLFLLHLYFSTQWLLLQGTL